MANNYFHQKRSASSNNAQTSKTSYEIASWASVIRDKFLKALSEEKIPWDKPYRNARAYNFASAGSKPTPYILINQILLDAPAERIFASAAQIQAMNSEDELERVRQSHNRAIPKIHIKGGSKAQKVISMGVGGWTITVPKDDPNYEYAKQALKKATEYEKVKDFERYKNIIAELKEAGLIKYRKGGSVIKNVFSIDDIVGLEPDTVERLKQQYRDFNNLKLNSDLDMTAEERGDRFINAFFEANPQIQRYSLGLGSPNYNYALSPDGTTKELNRAITLPLKEQCSSLSEYYSTAFHEISHSQITEQSRREEQEKQKTRLSTTDTNARMNVYAQEEFQVEMTTFMVTNYLGLATPMSEKNNIAYCQGWKDRIEKLTDEQLFATVDKACKAAESLISTYDKAVNITEDKTADKKKVAVEKMSI